MNSGRAPDAIEPVVAWRAWFIQKADGEPHRLDSVIHRCVWPIRHELTASCLTTRGDIARKHFAPLDRCQCGIYGAATLERLANYVGQGLGPVPRLQAVGHVGLWGNVLVHEHGWRASHAYPVRFWLPRRNARDEPIANWEEVAFDLADYGVPVESLECGHSPGILAALRAWEESQGWGQLKRAA
jgi:hypothetical protein